LAGADVASALLGVVDDDHGDGVAALQLSQIGEQRRHLTAGVLNAPTAMAVDRDFWDFTGKASRPKQSLTPERKFRPKGPAARS